MGAIAQTKFVAAGQTLLRRENQALLAKEVVMSHILCQNCGPADFMHLRLPSLVVSHSFFVILLFINSVLAVSLRSCVTPEVRGSRTP
eukprot:1725625-Amphidinium_carterae.1